MSVRTPPKALAFDVFGTVVDWRTSIAALVGKVLSAAGHADIDAFAFTDDWRMRYLIGMRDFGQTGRGFVKLDMLHREMLDALLADMQFDLAEACLSVAVALAGVTALTKKRWLFGVAGVFAAFGFLFGLAGFFHWNLHSDLMARILG